MGRCTIECTLNSGFELVGRHDNPLPRLLQGNPPAAWTSARCCAIRARRTNCPAKTYASQLVEDIAVMLGHMWRPRRLLLRNRKMHVSNSLEATALGRLCVCLDIWDADALRWSCLSFDFVQRWPICIRVEIRLACWR